MWPGNFGARTRQVILRRRFPKEPMPIDRRTPARLLTIAALVLTLAGTMLAGSVASPATPSASALVSAATAEHAVALARSRRGSPYSYGAVGPRHFDCSGLTRWVYRHLGKRLPHSSAAQAHRVKRISRSNAIRGDLVFFYGGGGVHHVGIYAGHNRLWHAPYSGTRVRLERIWTRQVFFGRVR
jgi:cell wall-associated NlpC family hydrolase